MKLNRRVILVIAVVIAALAVGTEQVGPGDPGHRGLMAEG